MAGYRQSYTGSRVQALGMVLADKAGTGRHTRVQVVLYRQSDTGSPIQAVGYRHTGHGTGRQIRVQVDSAGYRQAKSGTGRHGRLQANVAGCTYRQNRLKL